MLQEYISSYTTNDSRIFCVTVVFKCEARLARPIFLVLLYSIFEPQPIISELKSEIDTGKKLEYIYITFFWSGYSNSAKHSLQTWSWMNVPQQSIVNTKNQTRTKACCCPFFVFGRRHQSVFLSFVKCVERECKSCLVWHMASPTR